MENKIICVRIAQRALPATPTSKYTRFPFERVYLCENNIVPQLKELFRYSLSFQLDKPLLEALNQLNINNIKETPVLRDDKRQRGTDYKDKRHAFLSHIQYEDVQHWTVLVPTHVKTRYKDSKNHKGPIASELGYVLSKIIMYGHNQGTKLPRITLHTPSRIVPILCGICRNVLELHEGNCVPGQPNCASRVKVTLKLDTHHTKISEKSIEESGGDI